MFYSQVILARKGPLGKIWLAAHFDKKLTKQQIFMTDISHSVEAVLNPTAPLALRVSGHLMLGIVRIYSRKVKYLMSDCTEAMWKIKLAFRPGNVDIDPTLVSSVNADDARFFGVVTAVDGEFPELENTAYQQYLLPTYDNAQQMASQSQQMMYTAAEDQYMDGNNFNNFDMMGGRMSQSPMIGDMSGSMGGAADATMYSGSSMMGGFGRVSDVEVTRAAGLSQRPSPAGRASLSTVGGHSGAAGSASAAGHGVGQQSRRTSRLSVSMQLEDDIPAFEDNKFDEQLLGDQNAPNFEDNQFVDFDNSFQQEEKSGFQSYSHGDNQQQGQYEEEQQQQQQQPDDYVQEDVQQQQQQQQQSFFGEDVASLAAADGTNAQVPKRRPAKRRQNRVLIDEQVELSARTVKARMADVSSILRRDPQESLPLRTSKLLGDKSYEECDVDFQLAMPLNIRGLCHELQEMFNMTSNRAPLPFATKPDILAAEEEQLLQQQQQQQQQLNASGQSMSMDASLRTGRVSDVEITRAAGERLFDGDSRRASSIQGGVGGGDQFLSFDAGGRFGEEVGGAGGGSFDDAFQPYDDYQPQGEEMAFENQPGFESVDLGSLDNTAQHTAASPARMSMSKLSLVGGPGGGLLQQQQQHKNIVSEKMSDTLTRIAPTASTGIGGEEKTTSSSSSTAVAAVADSLVLNQRTQAVLDILEDQFQTKESVKFKDISAGVSKRVAASCFLEVLQLKTWGMINAVQAAPFDDITLSAAAAVH